MKTTRITHKNADRLLEKYYDGLTTTEEERYLQQFLLQDNLPARYIPDKAILGYFAANKTHAPERTINEASIIPLRHRKRWLYPSLIGSGAVAAMLTLLFTFNYLTQPSTENYAYVHGERITDKALLTTTMQSSIDVLGASSEEVDASAALLGTEEDILIEQLQLLHE
ncbi:MAG TPA: hypothetical protein DD409_04640 [Bacteroidales bacterium]|nr:hypothetical protein [Bacteroidales bacterium]